MNVWKKSLASTLALSVFLLLALGSEPYHTDTTNLSTVPIQQGTVEKGVRIVADDGSFELRGGERFTSPFQNNIWTGYCKRFYSNNLLTQAEDALSCGAKKVRIYIGDRKTPLYGVLLLNSSVGSAFGAASRSYLIRLEEDKIRHADAGNTSVSYELVKYKKTGYWDDGRRTSSEATQYTWILWYSSYPF